MPGHKGKSFLGCENLDNTEIDGADVLYNAKGIIKMSEENASLIFGTQKCVYSTEGSSLAIRAMLWLASLYAKANGKNAKIAAARNAHKTFVTAAALMNFDVDWLMADKPDTIVSCKITADTVSKYLSEADLLPVAVYITSPDYIGNIADIRAISDVCHKHGVLLLVDNAHGAYLRFLTPSLHPTDHGADMCCDSAHKTLPVLTGGAYLHISQNAPTFFAQNAENAMSVFASTSPSYLILQSLDLANRYLSDGYTKKLGILIEAVVNIKTKLRNIGYSIVGDEPLKLTVAPKSYGYTGDEVADILNKKGFICEFYDPDFVVFMFTPENELSSLAALTDALLAIPKGNPIVSKAPSITLPKAVMSLSEALFCESEEIPIQDSTGKIAASPTVNCPPAIAVVVCGEIIDESMKECMEYYGIEKIKVTKNSP